MKFDGQFTIATGLSAKSKIWKNKKTTWSEFVERVKKPNFTTETHKEFINATKEEQLKIKDVGGYVGGYLRNGKRSPENVVHRQIMTLDIDFAHLNFWDDFCTQYGNAALIHATHKHCKADPRYRLIMPLSRECTPDEYVAVSRQIAGTLGIDLFDNTTFETNRLMFWQSSPKDVAYYFEVQDGEWLDVDAVLATYIDWKDTSLWPVAGRKFDEIRDFSKKQENPQDKTGIVGAFCRTYSITEAIAKFLPEDYTPASDDRYTYAKGSTAAGLIIYDDLFAYSHHGSDPISGMLCNAFDLVRIHKFGHEDNGSNERGTKAKSYTLMEDFCRRDKDVKKIIASESLDKAKFDFVKPHERDTEESLTSFSEENVDWVTEMDVDRRGTYLSTATNINLILANDSRLKGAFKQNEFDCKKYVCRTLPWRKIDRPEPVKNVDFAGVRNYIESIYGISGNLKIEDSLTLEFEKQTFHPVKDYLSSLVWDKKPRIDTLLIEYFGSMDSLYHREAIRKMLVGAVKRIFKPGCKFDLVLTLVGAQGTKKSTFIAKLGKQWFSDTFMTVQGKEALEQIQGSWLIEMAELAGLRKAEVEAVKHFITKQEDTFRPAYGRTSETYRRQCVFFGTTNNKDFLRDPSGNRRFMPIAVNPEAVTKDVFADLDKEVDQIWAEAVHLYHQKEPVFLSAEAEKLAKVEQRNHSEVDERQGVIEAYLNTPLPKLWEKMDGPSRKMYLDDPNGKGVTQRDFVCLAEIWCECLGKEKAAMSRYNTREIGDIMRALPEWEASKSSKRFPLYGIQRYYERILL